MFSIGQIVGGVIATFILGFLVDWLILKRLPISRSIGLILSAVVAVVVAIVLYGFGNADGGPWNPGYGYLTYGLGGLISGAIRYWRADAKGEFDDGKEL